MGLKLYSSVYRHNLEQAAIDVAGIPVKAYMDETGNKYLYLTSVAEAVGRTYQSVTDFLKSKAPEASLCNGLSVTEVSAELANLPGKHKLKLVPLDIAKFYWGYWYRKGDPLAASNSYSISRWVYFWK